MTIHLRSLTYSPPVRAIDAEKHPFNVPTIRALDKLEFAADVTFFIGDNGSGKSTLLEGIAAGANLPTIGMDEVNTDRTLADARALAKRMKLTWTKKTTRGFFMRAEDVFGFARRMQTIREDMERELADIAEEYKHRSPMARGLASMPFNRELHDMRQRYGAGVDARSHGESFFTLFESRFAPNGLYLLDEPETPLSPLRQLAFLRMIHQVVKQGGQFIIATHSPILMAYPNATIWLFEPSGMRQIAYDDTEHVTIMRDFLNHRESMLSHLFDE